MKRKEKSVIKTRKRRKEARKRIAKSVGAYIENGVKRLAVKTNREEESESTKTNGKDESETERKGKRDKNRITDIKKRKKSVKRDQKNRIH